MKAVRIVIILWLFDGNHEDNWCFSGGFKPSRQCFGCSRTTPVVKKRSCPEHSVLCLKLPCSSGQVAATLRDSHCRALLIIFLWVPSTARKIASKNSVANPRNTRSLQSFPRSQPVFPIWLSTASPPPYRISLLPSRSSSAPTASHLPFAHRSAPSPLLSLPLELWLLP